MKQHKEISKEIAKMVEVEQYWMHKAIKSSNPNSSIHKKVKEINAINFKRVKEIVEEYGLISISKFGKEASYNTWLLIQHSPQEELTFMKHYLSLMEQNPQEVVKKNIAYLKDRILVYQNEPQIYGTQLKWNKENNKWEASKLKNPEKVDELRKEMGLEPLEDYLKKHEEIYKK